MHHATARPVVSRILAGDGFGEAALAMVHAALLHERADVPAPVRQALMTCTLSADPDRAAAVSHPLNQQPVPADERHLCIQLAPILTAHPGNPALGASCLWALSRLWQHVGSEERPLLRTRFINSIVARPGEPGAVLTTTQLREWQKRVPTSYGVQPPSVASLRGILDAQDPLAAYLVLAEHLGTNVDLETLCWVTGSLSVGQILHFHDRQGLLVGLLHGAAACERLVPLVPPEVLVTLISQLTHRLWWSRHGIRLHPIFTSLDQGTRPFQVGVSSGDVTLAQRSARALASDPRRLWQEAWNVIGQQLSDRPGDAGRVLALCDAIHWRTGDGLASTDDAAALGGILAAVAWQRSKVPTP